MLLVVFLGVGLALAALLSALAPYLRKTPDLRTRRLTVALRGSITMPYRDDEETP